MSMKRNWKSPRLLPIWNALLMDQGCIAISIAISARISSHSQTQSVFKHRKPSKMYNNNSSVNWNHDRRTYGVKKGDTEALNNTVQSHELKHTEGGDESRSSLPVEKQHVWDSFVIGKNCLQYWRPKQAPSSTPTDSFSNHFILRHISIIKTNTAS